MRRLTPEEEYLQLTALIPNVRVRHITSGAEGVATNYDWPYVRVKFDGVGWLSETKLEIIDG